ncbi:MAG: glycosyltransferase [Terriglobales bacterium]
MRKGSKSNLIMEQGKCLQSGDSGPRIKVLFVVDSFNVGGTEHQVAEMSCRLPKGEFDLTVCCLKREGQFLKKVEETGIEVVQFSPGGTLISAHAGRQIIRLAWFIRQRGFEIVHAHDLWSNLMGIPAAFLAHTPLIICSRRDLGHLSWYTPGRERIIEAIQWLSGRVVANSAAVKEMILAGGGISDCKVVVLHNGVDFGKFATARGDRSVLFPGVSARRRLVAVVANMHSEVKGHSFLIDAAAVVCRVHSEVLFALIGDGEMREQFERRVADLELQDNFLFLGEQPDVAERLRCCDLFVLPSVAEGMPNALLEAMAAGLPAVATRVGGAREIIEDGISGVIVEPRSASALAEGILRILRSPDMAADMARSGQERVRNEFSFESLIHKLTVLYRGGGEYGS